MPALAHAMFERAARAGAWARITLPRYEGRVAALGFACVLVVTYANVVFEGDSLVHSNNLNMIDFRMTERTYGPGFRPASTWTDHSLSPTANLHDPGATFTQWETGGAFLRRSLWEGDLPFWDPYTGGGVPAMANLVQAFFFPPYLLVVVLGNGVLLKNVYFLSLLLAAAWCTWAFLRRSGLSWTASFAGGLAFLLSGGLTQTVGSFIGQTACCLPMGLLATRWFLERATWSAAAVLALALAALSLASFPPLLMAVFGLAAAYAASVLLTGPDFVRVPPVVAATRFAVGAGLGLGMVAWYYLPAFSLMAVTPQVRNFYRDASSHSSVYASGLLQLLAPGLMGGVPIWAVDPIPRSTVASFNHVGTVALLLVATVGWRQLRRPVWLMASVAVPVVLGLMFGPPPFEQLRALPVLRNVHFANYYAIVLDLLLALLAAAGFEQLLRTGVSRVRACGAAGLLLLSVLIVMLVGASVGVASHPTYAAWLTRYVVLVGIALTAVTLLVVAASSANSRHRMAFGWALMTLLAIEGVWNTHFPRQNRWDVWRNPPAYVEYLQQHAGLDRVFTIGGALYANSGSAFKVMQLDSLMAFNPPRLHALYGRYGKALDPLFLRHPTEIPPDAVLDAANISLVVIATDLKGPLEDVKARGLERVFSDGLIQIFRRAAPPRFFFTSAFHVSSRRRALEDVAIPRPHRTIVVEGQSTFPSEPNAGPAPVTIERLSNNFARLSLVAPRPGFVYASDSFMPGWTARVNGQDVPIQPANYAFKAVAVAGGPVTVELRYVPPGFLPGLGVSAIALVTVALMLASGRKLGAGARGDEHLAGKEGKESASADGRGEQTERRSSH